MEAIAADQYARVHELARGRIMDAIVGSEDPGALRGEVEERILSYPLARFVVAAVGDRNLVKWFAHREAEVSAGHLMEEDADFVLAVGKELGLEASAEGGAADAEARRVVKGVRPAGVDRMDAEKRVYWVTVTGYLQARQNISGPEWDLPNQRLVSGRIGLNRRRYVRLLQELMKRRIEAGLDQEASARGMGNLGRIIGQVRDMVESRRKAYKPASIGKVTITRMPPCMRQILGMAQSGENLPHHARFTLVTFLNSIGMPPEEIFKVFSTAPDFKEEIVRYQIEHITGQSSGTEYRVPGCDTMKSGGICYQPDTLCAREWMSSPYVYYRAKGRKDARKGEGSTS
jgi:DNA primase large subunit